jgi:transcriptional regulator with XRE-family HTH domain
MTRAKDEVSSPLPRFSAEDQRSFGSRVVRQRRARGWNQKELARRTLIRNSRLSRLERGRAVPRIEELLRLKSVLGGTVDDLLSEPDPTSSVFGPILQDLEIAAPADDLYCIGRLLRTLTLGFRLGAGEHSK